MQEQRKTWENRNYLIGLLKYGMQHVFWTWAMWLIRYTCTNIRQIFVMFAFFG